MISEEDKNTINFGLAVMFTASMILKNGLLETYKNIDKIPEPATRSHFRYLVQEAIENIKSEGLEIPT